MFTYTYVCKTDLFLIVSLLYFDITTETVNGFEPAFSFLFLKKI